LRDAHSTSRHRRPRRRRARRRRRHVKLSTHQLSSSSALCVVVVVVVVEQHDFADVRHANRRGGDGVGVGVGGGEFQIVAGVGPVLRALGALRHAIYEHAAPRGDRHERQ
jgi:hypothetical protein